MVGHFGACMWYFIRYLCPLRNLLYIFFLVDIIDNVKLRKFIYQRLSEELSDKIYYPYGKDIWILDLEEGNWYFQYNSEGKLNYNPKFFDDFFYFFSLEQKQYQILLKKWVESSFGYQINQISRVKLDISYYIDGITRGTDKNWKLNERYGFSYSVVKRFLEQKKHIPEKNIKLEHFLHEIEVY
jgi:hypothetical protein